MCVCAVPDNGAKRDKLVVRGPKKKKNIKLGKGKERKKEFQTAMGVERFRFGNTIRRKPKAPKVVI